MDTWSTRLSHLFPGARVSLGAAVTLGDAIVVFESFNVVAATASQQGDEVLLEVDSYRTLAGATIGAKRWGLRPDGADYVVTARR